MVRGSWFVVVVFYVPTVPTVLQYYSTDLLYMCSKQKHKEDHGHKKGQLQDSPYFSSKNQNGRHSFKIIKMVVLMYEIIKMVVLLLF